MKLTDEIMHDDEAFTEWLNQTFESEKIAKWFVNQREQTLEYMEKIAEQKLPSNFFEQATEPPFEPSQDPHDGARTCPHGNCDEAGRRTGFIRIERYKPKRDEYVEVNVYCRCHPGYKKYGDKYGAKQEEIENKSVNEKHEVDEPDESPEQMFDDQEPVDDDIPF